MKAPKAEIPQAPRLDKTRVGKYKKGEEPNDVLYWLSRPAMERMLALERIRQEYNLWKYGDQSGFQRVYSIVERQRR